MPTATAPANPSTTRRPLLARLGWPLAVVVAGAVATWPNSAAAFFFDDLPSIPDNAGIAVGDWWKAAFGETHSPIAGRPIVCATFALDRAVWGLRALPMRIENVALHLLNGLLVLLAVRGALRGANLAARFDEARAARVAGAVALLWSVHPLATDAVAYVTQRTTLLAAAFFLLALVAWQRGRDGGRGANALAVLAATAGMACKEELVALPLLFLLYERAFERPDWRAVRTRLPVLVALAASSWTMLALCVAGAPHNSTVGYDTEPRCTAVEWLQTQTVPVLGYLQKTLWPTGFVGYSDWPIQRDLGPVLLPGLAVLALLGATAWACVRRPWWGFCGAAFFLLLAPTSSILPIVTELVAERRAYLPSIGVLAMLFVAVDAAVRAAAGRERPAVFVALAAALALACVPLTRARVAVYTDPATYWEGAAADNELTNRSFQAGMVLSNLGLVRRKQGRLEESQALFQRALECAAPTPYEKLHYAMVLAQRENHTMAEPLLRALAAEAPDFAEGRATLATYLVESTFREPRAVDGVDPRLVEATEHARAAVRLGPRSAAAWNTLAWLCQQQGILAEAETAARRAIELEPGRPQPHVVLCDVLLAQDRVAEARQHMGDLLQSRPADLDLRLGLVEQMLQRRDFEGARRLLEDCMRIGAADLRVIHAIARLRAQQAGGR